MTHKHHNNLHLGDCLIHLNYLKRCCLADDRLSFEFRVNPGHLAELNGFLPPFGDRIQIVSSIDRFPDSIDTQMLPTLIETIKKIAPETKTMRNIRGYQLDFGQFYVDFLKAFSMAHNLPIVTRGVSDLATLVPETIPESKRSYDFLVINAPSIADEWDYRQKHFDRLLWLLKKEGHSVICTHPNNAGVFWTLSEKWPLTQVAKLAQQCRNIISVNTSPLWASLNPVALERVQYWLVLCRGHYLKFNDRFEWSRTMQWAMQLLRNKHFIP